MEKSEDNKSSARLIINVLVWAFLIAYFAYSNGYLEKSVFDDAKRVVADVLVKSIDAFGSSSSTLRLQVEAGKLYFDIGDNERALDVLEATLPRIAQLDNVQQRRYASVFFVLGEIEAEKALFKRAEDFFVRGLGLEPQNFHYQLCLGDVYAKAGKQSQAREHYIELLEVPNLGPEQRALVRMKVAESGGEDPSTVAARKELTEMNFLDYQLITLVPINDLPDAVALDELCLVLESVFRMGCLVRTTMHLNTAEIGGRDSQVDSVNVIEVLESTYPRAGVAPIVGIMTDDIYTGAARFVFSTQSLDTGYGVVSTFRFFQTDRKVERNEKIYTRRLAIQLISVVGQLLGLPRPVKPYCPLAYPNSLDEFLMKRASLCSSTQRALEGLLAEIGAQDGVRFSKLSQAKIDRILLVKARYGIDG